MMFGAQQAKISTLDSQLYLRKAEEQELNAIKMNKERLFFGKIELSSNE